MRLRCLRDKYGETFNRGPWYRVLTLGDTQPVQSICSNANVSIIIPPAGFRYNNTRGQSLQQFYILMFEIEAKCTEMKLIFFQR